MEWEVLDYMPPDEYRRWVILYRREESARRKEEQRKQIQSRIGAGRSGGRGGRGVRRRR